MRKIDKKLLKNNRIKEKNLQAKFNYLKKIILFNLKNIFKKCLEKFKRYLLLIKFKWSNPKNENKLLSLYKFKIQLLICLIKISNSIIDS